MPFTHRKERMLKNKFFIAFLAVMLVVALVYNIHYFSTRGKPKVRQPTPDGIESMDASLTNHTDSSSHPLNTDRFQPIVQPKTMTQNLKRITVENKPWGRNPFLTPDEATSIRLSQSQNESEDQQPTRIKGILIGDKQRVAIIDHTIVTEGDWIGPEQVVRIDKDKVVLTLGKSQRVITMEQSPVSIIVEKTEHNEI